MGDPFEGPNFMKGFSSKPSLQVGPTQSLVPAQAQKLQLIPIRVCILELSSKPIPTSNQPESTWNDPAMFLTPL